MKGLPTRFTLVELLETAYEAFFLLHSHTGMHLCADLYSELVPEKAEHFKNLAQVHWDSACSLVDAACSSDNSRPPERELLVQSMAIQMTMTDTVRDAEVCKCEKYTHQL